VVLQKYRKAGALPNEKILRVVNRTQRASYSSSSSKTEHVAVARDLPRAWRGAALARGRPPRDICLGAWMATHLLKQAAPANVSTRYRFIGELRGLKIPERHDGTNLARGNSGEPPVFARFGGIALRRNSRGRRDTCQSGSPPGVYRTTQRPFRGRGRRPGRLRERPTSKPQQFPLPIHQYLRSRLRLAGHCLEDTPGRDDGRIQT
jgi:hypothetical protein